MYIEIGSTIVNYPTRQYDDFIVFSEVIDSQVGYERPVLVRTLDQLDKWFGRDFTDRNYFEELISSGVTLLLTKPLESYTNDLGIEFPKEDNLTGNETFYSYNSLPETGNSNLLYRVFNPNGLGEFSTTIRESTVTYDIYRWYNSEDDLVPSGFYKESDLPSIKKADSHSLNNRDTLRLYSVYDITGNTVYSHFSYEDPEGGDNSVNPLTIDLSRVELGYQTLVFDIVEEGELQENAYLVIPDPTDESGRGILAYHGDVSELVDEKYYKSEESFEDLNGLFSILASHNIVKNDNQLIVQENAINATFFYKGLGIDLIPNYLSTHRLLSKSSNLNQERIVDFWSKTIGTAGIDGNITVTIEKSLEEGNYRIILERFGHTEVFEGPIKITTAGEERLDYQISRHSEIAYCDFAKGIEELPIGTWALKGAIEETYNYESYNNGLDEIFEEADRTYPDFFLIPNPSLYFSDNIERFYKKILGYAEESGCQVLIENGEEGTRNSYVYNYTGDVYNRLVYFYRPMTFGDENRPGYYVFIKGLLNDVYSVSTDDIYYKSIKDFSNPYKENNLSTVLKDHKSNYLIDNGLTYYYKEYQNGDNYETSIWMRFVLGKVKRELEKNKWKYLGEKNQGKIYENISAILTKILSRFGIIRRLELLDIRFHLEDNKVDVDIETTISDLVKNNMIINFTINYNKQ